MSGSVSGPEWKTKMRVSVGCVGKFTKSHRKRELRISGKTLHTLHTLHFSPTETDSEQLIRTGKKIGPGTIHFRIGRGEA